MLQNYTFFGFLKRLLTIFFSIFINFSTKRVVYIFIHKIQIAAMHLEGSGFWIHLQSVDVLCEILHVRRFFACLQQMRPT